MRYHVLLQGSTYEWILSALEGEREKIDAERAITWQRQGGYYGYAYICTPVREKRGVWKVVEIHNVGHPKNQDAVQRFWVDGEIQPDRAIYTEEAWEAMLKRFWPEESI